MTDLVQRLRNTAYFAKNSSQNPASVALLLNEAAARIEKLERDREYTQFCLREVIDSPIGSEPEVNRIVLRALTDTKD